MQRAQAAQAARIVIWVSWSATSQSEACVLPQVFCKSDPSKLLGRWSCWLVSRYQQTCWFFQSRPPLWWFWWSITIHFFIVGISALFIVNHSYLKPVFWNNHPFIAIAIHYITRLFLFVWFVCQSPLLLITIYHLVNYSPLLLRSLSLHHNHQPQSFSGIVLLRHYWPQCCLLVTTVAVAVVVTNHYSWSASNPLAMPHVHSIAHMSNQII